MFLPTLSRFWSKGICDTSGIEQYTSPLLAPGVKILVENDGSNDWFLERFGMLIKGGQKEMLKDSKLGIRRHLKIKKAAFRVCLTKQVALNRVPSVQLRLISIKFWRKITKGE